MDTGHVNAPLRDGRVKLRHSESSLRSQSPKTASPRQVLTRLNDERRKNFDSHIERRGSPRVDIGDYNLVCQGDNRRHRENGLGTRRVEHGGAPARLLSFGTMSQRTGTWE